jgi:hypothetical protein
MHFDMIDPKLNKMADDLVNLYKINMIAATMREVIANQNDIYPEGYVDILNATSPIIDLTYTQAKAEMESDLAKLTDLEKSVVYAIGFNRLSTFIERM